MGHTTITVIDATTDTRARQIHITPAAHRRLLALAAELGITPRAAASTILNRYCSREAYAAALTGQPIEAIQRVDTVSSADGNRT